MHGAGQGMDRVLYREGPEARSQVPVLEHFAYSRGLFSATMAAEVVCVVVLGGWREGKGMAS